MELRIWLKSWKKWNSRLNKQNGLDFLRTMKKLLKKTRSKLDYQSELGIIKDRRQHKERSRLIIKERLRQLTKTSLNDGIGIHSIVVQYDPAFIWTTGRLTDCGRKKQQEFDTTYTGTAHRVVDTSHRGKLYRGSAGRCAILVRSRGTRPINNSNRKMRKE